MPFAFFHILAIDPQAETERLNAYLASHTVLQVDLQFVADGAKSLSRVGRVPTMPTERSRLTSGHDTT